MSRQLGVQDATEEILSNPVTFFSEAFAPVDSQGVRYTERILVVILGFFALEVSLSVLYNAGSTYNLVSYFFKNHPWLVWPVAPFLHRGIGHFAANVAFIYIAAPVETRMSKVQYVGLLLFSGFLAVYADGLKLAVFGSEPHVAAYGASGFAFGLLGYGLSSIADTDWQLTPRWWLIVACGISAILLVIKNSLLAVSDPISLNIGHLGGLLVGLLFGHFGRAD
ncbi:rhomboid family intramembrane serine protease [Salinibaculum rarum]|uniref:rhomboid family intramembrane serine protease n=1 Tax=Salinibaculum rarum TaxID=3058903 RepID=UPI00265DB981|nr:rhomboid family intramembrane serine protease [Salinibaculum sp. KK48]